MTIICLQMKHRYLGYYNYKHFRLIKNDWEVLEFSNTYSITIHVSHHDCDVVSVGLWFDEPKYYTVFNSVFFLVHNYMYINMCLFYLCFWSGKHISHIYLYIYIAWQAISIVLSKYHNYVYFRNYLFLYQDHGNDTQIFCNCHVILQI